MKKVLIPILMMSLSFSLFASGETEAVASIYPDKQVTAIVPYNAGGGSADITVTLGGDAVAGIHVQAISLSGVDPTTPITDSSSMYP